jgi:hypothetical protein
MVEGCCDANNFLKSQSYCEKCPFGDCIHDLKPTEKSLIFKADIIQNVLVCYDSGMTVEQISRWYNHISVNQIRNWLKNRGRVLAKLERYAPCY